MSTKEMAMDGDEQTSIDMNTWSTVIDEDSVTSIGYSEFKAVPRSHEIGVWEGQYLLGYCSLPYQERCKVLAGGLFPKHSKESTTSTRQVLNAFYNKFLVGFMP